MRITFSPIRWDRTLELEKTSGDRLRINGELFNFNTLPEGGTIPAGAIPSDWIVGPVERVDGEVFLTLNLPHGPLPPGKAAVAPPTITVTADGPIAVPNEELADVVA